MEPTAITRETQGVLYVDEALLSVASLQDRLGFGTDARIDMEREGLPVFFLGRSKYVLLEDFLEFCRQRRKIPVDTDSKHDDTTTGKTSHNLKPE